VRWAPKPFITTIVVEDDETLHDVGSFDDGRTTFNACDAGSDGDIFMVVATEDSSNYFTDLHLYASRIGVVSAGPLEIDSVRTERQLEYDNYPLFLGATPPGQDIGQFDATSGLYDGGADFGPDSIHVFFREAESMTAWQDFGGTNTGYAFRTREYNTDSTAATFGEDFAPNAGAGAIFRLPFDIDLPFVDPNTGDDAENFEFAVCENTVGVWFTELQHIYYQECSGGSNNNSDSVGWRTTDGINGDPALVDDDNEVQLDNQQIDDFCVRSCTCCDLDGATVFWHKELDDDAGDERLQTRTRSGDSN